MVSKQRMGNNVRVRPLCSEREHRPHKTTLTSDTSCNLVVPQTTLTSGNSLEGLKELIQSCCTHDYSLLQGKNADENQPKEKAHWLGR